MDAFFGLLANYGPWGIIVGMLFYDRWRFNRGDMVPARTVEREQQNHRDLATAVEQMASALTKNTDALIGVQTSARDNAQATEATLDALEKLQRVLDDFRARSPEGAR